MKLIIQIPCYNEEETLPRTLADLPREVPGIDTVEWLIINDGSTDNTVRVAREHGVDHVVNQPGHLGLARAFVAGLTACRRHGADIIVNTDGDNQYDASCIKDLVKPIVDGEAEIVVGARPIDSIAHFSRVKKWLQYLGSWTVRKASNTDIPDAPSGFRAFSRYAAGRLNVFNNYTYTLETIIQAGQKGIPITWVPIRVNGKLRESRLVKSIPSYVIRSLLTIVRIWIIYRPFAFFFSLGLLLCLAGSMLGMRFLFYYFQGQGGGMVQSLILTSILIGIGFQTIMVSFVADMLRVNRRLLEELQSASRDSCSLHDTGGETGRGDPDNS